MSVEDIREKKDKVREEEEKKVKKDKKEKVKKDLMVRQQQVIIAKVEVQMMEQFN